MSGTSYDIRPSMEALADICKAAFVPDFVDEVYVDIPDLLGVNNRAMFFEYKGGTNERLTFGDATGATQKQRRYKVEAVAMVELAQHVTQADQKSKEMIGKFYEALGANDTLKGTVDDALVVSDQIQALPILDRQAPAVYVACVFQLDIIALKDA